MPKFNRTEKVLLGITAPVWIPFVSAFVIAITPIIWVAKGVTAVEGTSMYKTHKRKRDAKPPEVTSRPRALSIDNRATTIAPAVGSVHQENTAETQRLPLLFKLPRELRLVVYEELIGEDNIHIILIDGQLRSFRCKSKDCHNAKYGVDHCWIDHWQKATTPLEKPRYIYQDSGINILPLLQSCRAVYTDMIDVLYSTAHFQIHDYDSLFALASTILPQRLNTIRYLHIDGRRKSNWGLSLFPRHFPIGLPSYRAIRDLEILNPDLPGTADPADPLGAWALSCQLISKMEGLRVLVIDMDYPNRKYIWDPKDSRQRTVVGLERCLVEPMMALQGMGLRVLKVRFERFNNEAVHWLDLPFVELYPSVGEESTDM